MTILLEATRPYERLDSFDKMAVDAQIKGFCARARIPYPYVKKAPVAPPVAILVSNEALTLTIEPEPEIDFIPETETQKRTRQAAPASTEPQKRKRHRGPDTAAYQAVMAAIRSQGRALTGAEISAITGYNRKRASQITSRMKQDGLLFVAGFTEGVNDWTALYHTDPNVKQSSSAAAIFAEKRAARVRPSLAAMNQANEIIQANFRTDSIASRLYVVLACHGPLTASQLSTRAGAHLTEFEPAASPCGFNRAERRVW